MTLSFANGEGDIDVGLLNPAGTVVASSTSTGNSESYAYTAPTAGTYVAWVTLYEDAGAEGNGNAMTVSIS